MVSACDHSPIRLALRKSTPLSARYHPEWGSGAIRWLPGTIDIGPSRRQCAFIPSAAKYRRRTEADKDFEHERDAELSRLRRCYPVVEVVPSFNSEQGFEARLWIDGQPDKSGYELPTKVEWNAGRYFPSIASVDAADDHTFSARFSYYGPTLVQARLFWADGQTARSYIFAHFPGSGAAK